MENVADALKMAADFLVFITALAIGITSFSQARSTAQILLNYTDREYETQYVESTSDYRQSSRSRNNNTNNI